MLAVNCSSSAATVAAHTNKRAGIGSTTRAGARTFVSNTNRSNSSSLSGSVEVAKGRSFGFSNASRSRRGAEISPGRLVCRASGDDSTEKGDDVLEGWFDEDTNVFYEGSGSTAELIFSLLLAGTLVYLPLTMQSLARVAWITYKVTDKRFSVITNSPLKKERTDIAYSQMASVVAAPGGILGLWGDMVITTKRGDKLLIRALGDNYREIEEYMNERMELFNN